MILEATDATLLLDFRRRDSSSQKPPLTDVRLETDESHIHEALSREESGEREALLGRISGSVCPM